MGLQELVWSVAVFLERVKNLRIYQNIYGAPTGVVAGGF